ncbi:MAG: fibronectin/fibrinogen-binding protein [Ruminococcaceae bacterium]|nr:fibronectin/fibrinogen-binding protein [Oscillospiraceae bacterium]
MALDANTLAALAFELDCKLRGGRIDKIYQMSRSSVLLTVRSLGENYRLLLSCDASKGRICLTKQTFENPDMPPVFCMLMRKHLAGGKLLSVEAVPNERIVIVTVESTNELFEVTPKKLILEPMGKHSNIILTDENNRIIDAIRHIDFTLSEKRQVLPGLFYELPPVQEKIDVHSLSEEEFFSHFNEECPRDEISKKLMDDFLGMSPILAREIEHQSGGDFKKAGEIYWEYLTKLSQKKFEPTLLFKKGTKEPKDLYIWDILQYGDFFDKEPCNSVNECVDLFYKSKETKRRLEEKKDAVSQIITKNLSRLYKKIDIHEKNLKKAETKDRYRIYAELLTANLYQLTENKKEVTLPNYYEENAPLTIPLDETISPSRNAKKYFEKYNKEKTMEKISREMLTELHEEIRYLESVRDLLDLSDDEKTTAEIKEELVLGGYASDHNYSKNNKNKKKNDTKITRPMEFLSSDGTLILCGRNNRQNEELTLKIASKYDTWLHVRNVAGSHVVIRNQGESVSDETLYEAALVAAQYSKVANDTKVSVEYTKVKYVKKPSGAKPGMVIYDNFETIIVEPDAKRVERMQKK